MKTSIKIKSVFPIVFALFSILLFSNCTKDDGCPNSEKAELKNLTGLDGCGWVIELNNGQRLEPKNLSDFNIPLTEGKKVWVSYHETSGFSICMVGKIVAIDCMIER